MFDRDSLKGIIPPIATPLTRDEEVDVEEALVLQETSNRFVDMLDAMPSWTSTVKAALNLMGICGPTVAAPAPPLTAEETDVLRSHLIRYHLL